MTTSLATLLLSSMKSFRRVRLLPFLVDIFLMSLHQKFSLVFASTFSKEQNLHLHPTSTPLSNFTEHLTEANKEEQTSKQALGTEITSGIWK
jgi:hypothetical protein